MQQVDKQPQCQRESNSMILTCAGTSRTFWYNTHFGTATEVPQGMGGLFPSLKYAVGRCEHPPSPDPKLAGQNTLSIIKETDGVP